MFDKNWMRPLLASFGGTQAQVYPYQCSHDKFNWLNPWQRLLYNMRWEQCWRESNPGLSVAWSAPNYPVVWNFVRLALGAVRCFYYSLFYLTAIYNFLHNIFMIYSFEKVCLEMPLWLTTLMYVYHMTKILYSWPNPVSHEGSHLFLHYLCIPLQCKHDVL